MALKAVGLVFRSETAFHAAQKLGRIGELPLSRKDGQGEGWIDWLPGMLGGWTQVRDLRVMPKQTFREWFEARGKDGAGRPAGGKSLNGTSAQTARPDAVDGKEPENER
jgi:L-lactate dehydrogenase complex protein LldF